MSVAKTTTSEGDTTPYSEFVRALDLIVDTQLDMFVDSSPPGTQATLEKYELLVEKAEVEIDAEDSQYEELLSQKRIDIMRQVLCETINLYNDKYSNYIYPEAYKKYLARRNGQIVGVGLKFRAVKGGLPLVIGPLSNGPLDGENIKPGDKLVSINEKPLSGLLARQIEESLKGPVDSVVTLELLRDSITHTVHVKRSAVDLSYADSQMLEHAIGYLKISRFGGKTHEQVGALLSELIDRGARGFILDLRDNPGGSTRAARAIISMFSVEQDMYCEKNKTGDIKPLPRFGKHKTDMPLVVMINGDSMSCSEVVAGAVKTYGRGTVVGTTSFGKGLVQRVFELQEPLGGALRTTIAEMLRPDHKIIHATGIVPDVLVDTESDFMFKRTGSLNISDEARTFQRELLESEVRKTKPDKAVELIEAKDAQLQVAIDSLLPLLKA